MRDTDAFQNIQKSMKIRNIQNLRFVRLAFILGKRNILIS